jgi:hypothetical protein
MPDYSKGIVYALVADDKVYIGSTTQRIKKRIGGHKKQAINPQKHGSSKEIVLNPTFTYVIVETCPCDSKGELLIRERYWIENYAIQNPGFTVVNLKVRLNPSREEIVELRKAYYEANKRTELERRKARYEANKRTELERRKAYYEANKRTELELRKAWYEANKDKISQRRAERVSCDVCGKEVSRGNLTRHKKSSTCIKK